MKVETSIIMFKIIKLKGVGCNHNQNKKMEKFASHEGFVHFGLVFLEYVCSTLYRLHYTVFIMKVRKKQSRHHVKCYGTLKRVLVVCEVPF